MHQSQRQLNVYQSQPTLLSYYYLHRRRLARIIIATFSSANLLHRWPKTPTHPDRDVGPEAAVIVLDFNEEEDACIDFRLIKAVRVIVANHGTQCGLSQREITSRGLALCLPSVQSTTDTWGQSEKTFRIGLSYNQALIAHSCLLLDSLDCLVQEPNKIMRPPSLRITNRPKPSMGQGLGRSGKRSGRKEAYSRASSNFYTWDFSGLEETSTDSGEDTSDPDSEWECEDTSSPGSDDAEEGECPTCSRTAEVMRNWTGNESPGIRVGTFGAFQQEKQRCDTCRRFVDYFTKEFRKREGRDASLPNVTPVLLSRSTDNWAFRVGKSKARPKHRH